MPPAIRNEDSDTPVVWSGSFPALHIRSLFPKCRMKLSKIRLAANLHTVEEYINATAWVNYFYQKAVKLEGTPKVDTVL